MHPLVRDLYKRALVVGKDYPLGIDYVRKTWKKALRNHENCPSCYDSNGKPVTHVTESGQMKSLECEKEIRRAVGKGRHMIREMVGVIQLKKYRTMKKRYTDEKPQSFGKQDEGPTK